MRAPPLAFHRRHLLAGGAVAATVTMLPSFQPALAASARPRDGAPLPRLPLPRLPFAGDVRLPGLLHAVVARPPLPCWRLAGFDPSPALRVKGVVGLVRLDPWSGPGLAGLGGIAVVARDTWSAMRGRDALVPDWTEAATSHGQEAADDATHHATDAFRPATAEPLMEPPSATALAEAGRCTLWCCLRDPEPVRATLAALLGLDPDAVTLHPTASAAAQGRFTNPAYALEAARLSRATGGAPVSLTWTREDDLPFCGPGAWS